jgi:hypothetical protein
LAVTPRDPESFYREVDEELRRDQMSRFARRFGPLVIGAVLLFLAAVGGLLWWENHQTVKAEKQAEELTAIFDDIDAGKTKGIDARLDKVSKDGNDAYRAAALLTKADLAVQAGKDAEAIDGFRKIAADEGLAQPYRDVALIRQTALEYDKLPPAKVVERLKSLAVKGNPWFGSAGEMVAIAYMKQGKPELAAPIFAAMAKDENVPAAIRSRAVQMAGALGVDAVPDTSAGATKEVSR